MRSKRPLYILLGVLALIVIVVGFRGIQSQHVVRAGSCEQHYQQHAVQPFLFNVFQCAIRKPCGTRDSVIAYNAEVDVLQCLCDDTVTNAKDIQSFYQETRRGVASIDEICTQKLEKVYAH